MASKAAKLRLEVLGGYRRLMKLRKQVFAGDQFAIGASRVQLREEFLKNKEVKDLQQIGKSIGFTKAWKHVRRRVDAICTH